METKLKQLLKTIKLNESMLSMIFGVVTVLLIGVLVMRMYSANKPTITSESEKTELATEKIGDVSVETKEDGKQYPTYLAETVKVEKGDNLWKIAEKQYGSGYNWVDIAKENKLANAGSIEVGQELKLPKTAVKVVEKPVVAAKDATTPTITGESYKVAKGDYLWSIAVRAYGDGYKWVEIARANGINLKTANYIEVGQELKLPR
ncbi:MAG: LysM peptidoglycan-binding domain-containing protein [Microgenomates group bacterium]